MSNQNITANNTISSSFNPQCRDSHSPEDVEINPACRHITLRLQLGAIAPKKYNFREPVQSKIFPESDASGWRPPRLIPLLASADP